ncbi:MAG: hypothetical protein IK062_06705 [Selenomonadaceae bacterium]|nr:hypothetical protein [Selenomonadaceae bacterium]
MFDLNALNQKKSETQNKIDELEGTQKILDAIKNQRWFFFENNRKLIFDSQTALLWANLDFFPYCKSENMAYYSRDGRYIEVRNLIEDINEKKFGGCSNWKIPTVDEFEKMVLDKTFPFCDGGYVWYIKNHGLWCVIFRDRYNGINLASNPTLRTNISDYNVFVIPCNESLRPQNFYYSPENILKIFSQTKLIPKFNDDFITQLCKKNFSNKEKGENVEELKNQLAEIEKQIEEENKKPKLTAKFDYKPLLKTFDVEEIKKSPIKYFKSVLSLSDELLKFLDEYEKANNETIGEFSKITLKLSEKFIENPNLSAEENNLLENRQKFLEKNLELGMNEVKFQILSVKWQAEEFFIRLKKINREKNSIERLAKLENSPRVSFEFLAENLANIICDAQKKIDFLTLNKNLVTTIVNLNNSWNENYKSFKTNLQEELKNICRAENIEQEECQKWFADWQNKRFAIEEKFLPIAEFCLNGNLLENSAIQTLEILQNYKNSVDKFYLNERKNIYQKFVFQAGGDLQEKFETESELYKLTENLQIELQKIIFSREKTEERIFLLKWAETLLNIPIDEIMEFVKEKELDAISEEVLTQFAELKRRNFSAYLADTQSYSDAIKKREKDYNALIFRMRKDLQKNKN